MADTSSRSREEEKVLVEQAAPLLRELYGQAAEKSDLELIGQFVDSEIAAMLESKSIYLYVWASRRFRPQYYVAYVVSMVVQLAVPSFVVIRHASCFAELGQCFTKFELTWDVWVEKLETKVTCIVLAFYLCSTCLGACKRSLHMMVMCPCLPERSVVGLVGAFTIMISIHITVLATAVLFIEDPGIADILLNCIALNFLPDVDCALSDMIQLADIAAIGHTQDRLVEVGEHWEKSRERLNFLALFAMPWRERFAADPKKTLLLAFVGLVNVESFTLPVLMALVTGCGAEDLA